MQREPRLARVGYIAFLFSGFCAISGGIVVNIIQQKYGFNYSLTGTLIAFMSFGNMFASFTSGVLPSRIGMRKTALLLGAGYALGYLMMSLFGAPGLLMAAFMLVGFGRGCCTNTCNVLVSFNSHDRTRGLSLLHAIFSIGAMLCPFLITALKGFGSTAPMLGVAAAGLMVWLTYLFGRLPDAPMGRDASGKTDYAFLKDGEFWLLTALIFCQNGAETAVTGWMVTYYRSTGILGGALSTYTVTVMWCATLIGRLLIAFVLKIDDVFKTLAIMGLGCTAMYLGLIRADTPVFAIVMLFLFAFALAGVNPVGIAGVGRLMSPASVGLLLPIASLGQIVVPWTIGIVADRIGLRAAMAVNLIPCFGIFVLSAILRKKRA